MILDYGVQNRGVASLILLIADQGGQIDDYEADAVRRFFFS
jgi:hypothetical protein